MILLNFFLNIFILFGTSTNSTFIYYNFNKWFILFFEITSRLVFNMLWSASFFTLSFKKHGRFLRK